MLRYYYLGSAASRKADHWRQLFPWLSHRYDCMAQRFWDEVHLEANRA